MSIRKVKRVATGMKTMDGAGVRLTRVLSRPDVEDFDPFLMLDAFDSKNPDDYVRGFPWHPHRGIETVTYLISGDIEHGDSLGNKGSIIDGSCQWMTAGCGIIHQEMPKPSKHMLGAQLWINLPKKDKMTKPVYNDIQPNMMVDVKEDNGEVIVISGSYKGKKAKMQGDYVKTLYLDVNLKPNKTWELDTIKDDTVFAYIVEGSFDVDGKNYESKEAVLFEKGDKVSLKSGKEGARFLFLEAKPLKEPVAWGGPIVMNTREELVEAFEELDEGTFEKGCDKAHKDFYE